MSLDKIPIDKVRLHVRNRNREPYNLPALINSIPALKPFIKPNKFGENSIDFANPTAVKLLNKALLNHYYGVDFWDFPDENLCPPIPGRADYIHHMADLLAAHNLNKIPIGEKIICLDIGIGANCIYPILGTIEYGWTVIGSDINPKSIASAQNIVSSNPVLKGKIECRLQKNLNAIFQGIIGKKEQLDLTICNPPFHASLEEAQKGTRRKVKNLSGVNEKNPKLNFAGIYNELICEGGEIEFIQKMISESSTISKNCFWFSTLVSKKSNLLALNKMLDKSKAKEIKIIPLGTGNKSSRILAWTFLSKNEQKGWREKRWNN